MDKLLKLLLGTTLYILEQSDRSTKNFRSRASESIDDIRDYAQDKYEGASDRVARASRVIRGEDNQFLGNALSLTAGVAIGIAIGLVFAPASGEETRSVIADKVHMVGDKFKKSFSDEEDFPATGTIR